MKYFLIAGEASGDLHASNLICELRKLDEKGVFCGFGGDLMRQAGCNIIQDYRNMAYMGFVAVALNIKKIHRNLQLAKQSILETQPDHLILIDYPTFNLKIAKFAKHHLPQTKIHYYVPPKVWAWKTWRIHNIARYSDNILGIFPFEPDFYAKYGYKAHYVGNPTAETVAGYNAAHKDSQRQRQIAIVPGSRKYEVEKCLPVMLRAALKTADQYEIIVTQAPTLDDKLYNDIINKTLGNKAKKIRLSRETYHAVSTSCAAIVNSGTATLETALLDTPQVAVYHVEFPHLMGALRNILFSIPYFTLVNIIAQKQVITELLAYEFTEENVSSELQRLLTDSGYCRQMLAGYQTIKDILGTRHSATSAARLIKNS